jgi:hypothetical protein
MAEGRFRDQEHLLRLAGLALGALLCFVVLRHFLVPRGFGVYGHYRAGALQENRAEPVSFAGQDACLTCHDDARRGGKHAAVRCEACHGALARHASAEDPTAVKPERPDASLCLRCHLVNVAKPKSFPQIDLKDHGGAGSCLTCHEAHRPADPPKGAS